MSGCKFEISDSATEEVQLIEGCDEAVMNAFESSHLTVDKCIDCRSASSNGRHTSTIVIKDIDIGDNPLTVWVEYTSKTTIENITCGTLSLRLDYTSTLIIDKGTINTINGYCNHASTGVIHASIAHDNVEVGPGCTWQT